MTSGITATASISIDASREAVWQALTDPEMIKEYFFGTDTVTTWEVGSPLRFKGEWEGKTYEDKGTVLAFKKGEQVKYDYWSSMSGTADVPENYGIVTYDLSGDDGAVTVTVTQENIRDEKTRDHSVENWNVVLNQMKDLLEKK